MNKFEEFMKSKLSKNEKDRQNELGLTPLEDKILGTLYFEGCFDDMTSKQVIPIVKKVSALMSEYLEVKK